MAVRPVHTSRPPELPVTTGRAVWFTAPRRIEVRDERLPAVGPHDVRVEALASAISHGTEMLVYRGQVPTDLALDLSTLAGSFAFPIKYGYASVGRVTETGAATSRLSRGDLVFCHHPHQSAYVVAETLPVRLPPGIAPDDAVFLANLETAFNVVLDAHPYLGDRVLVLGQGVVGLLITQLLHRAGAQVIAVDPIPERRGHAAALGATALTPEAVGDHVQSLTGGTGADLAIEVSGSPEAIAQAVRLVAFQGTVVVCSWYGSKPVNLLLGDAFHRRRLRLVSSQVSHVDPALSPRWTRERRLETAIGMLPGLELGSLVSHRFPLARAAEAYALIDRSPEQVLQVVFSY
jgi:2-desacetyl-2-hydroxyethyl bacteriochlorophyllide A dehydrogenase